MPKIHLKKTRIGVWLSLSFLLISFSLARDCTLVDDYYGKNVPESVCYLSCLSNALNKLYNDGEEKLFVNEEVYADASRILDDMEGETAECVKYLSVISGVMEGKHDKLEKLISYGNEMGDLVAKVGGLFADVNESVRAMREVLPSTLITANKYYTAISEIVRTVWDDVKAVKSDDEEVLQCRNGKIISTGEFSVKCSAHTCPLGVNVTESTLKKYKDGCLEINVMTESGQVSKCFNLPRNNLYISGARINSSGVLEWSQNDSAFFRLIVKVQDIFAPLIAPFSAGKPPSVLLTKMTNITSLYSHFNKVHNNFTSLLRDTNITVNADNTNTNSTI
ncbi:expression site-associated gene (ESAG) protein, putative [Trypanosoma brucei brucei TREU927]|uniref:Expression site-associated gene (ESAG) protein, putative n=1 Tax=Trypanosoma brucei brucei (strain 927/4 GUTat10.1) TaxID=185431 RepID=Q380X2_TRYB2|nr:expression site-associated gene (ESAG) protein, putative [Trypanosoma brucei brucei TREU927]EAN80659.1 expression site-associated gene (ESAG) protein, putative [Trypanosoma brucei brucei TREU927]